MSGALSKEIKQELLEALKFASTYVSKGNMVYKGKVITGGLCNLIGKCDIPYMKWAPCVLSALLKHIGSNIRSWELFSEWVMYPVPSGIKGMSAYDAFYTLSPWADTTYGDNRRDLAKWLYNEIKDKCNE